MREFDLWTGPAGFTGARRPHRRSPSSEVMCCVLHSKTSAAPAITRLMVLFTFIYARSDGLTPQADLWQHVQ